MSHAISWTEKAGLRYSPRRRRWDPRKAIEEIGLLAAIFDHAKLQVSMRGLRRARKLIETTRARYTQAHPERLVPRVHKQGRLLQVSLLVD